MTKLVHIKDFDVSKVEFELDAPAQSVWTKYDGDRFLLQFPKLSCPFKKAVDDYKGNKSFQITVAVPDDTITEKLEALEEKYVRFMAANIDGMKKKKPSENMSYEKLLDHSFNTVDVVRQWKDVNLLRFKLPTIKDTETFLPDIRIVDTDGESSDVKLTHDDISQFDDCKYTFVCRMYGNFIGSLSFTMRTVRMILHKQGDSCQFIEEDSEEENNEEDYEQVSSEEEI